MYEQINDTEIIMRGLWVGLLAIGVSACVAAEEPAPLVQTKVGDYHGGNAPWHFDDHAATLRTASCPEGTAFERAVPLHIEADAIDSGSAKQQAEQLQGMRFAGAWHLTADDENFGGLSGLAVMRSGSLLAISDAGAWVSIGIDPATGAPDGLGSIGYMRDANGKFFATKRKGDSEGLAFHDGLALVSFEQRHRIEAFDLEGCGMAARAARVVRLPAVVGGKKVPDNRGAEALSLFQGGGLQVGFEFRTREGSPAGRVVADRDLTDTSPLYQPGLYLLTGMDYRGDMMIHVFRAYDPLRGSRVRVRVSPVAGGDDIAFADLKSPLPVDNFEGVAFGAAPSGATRIWLISDDNFNPDKQRTLLFAFDLD